jgi:hypothetical protein
MNWWKSEHRSWQSRGQGFDSDILHPEDQRVTDIKICDSFFSARILPEDGGKMGKTEKGRSAISSAMNFSPLPQTPQICQLNLFFGI